MGQELSLSFSSEVCMATDEQFYFSSIIFVAKPLLPCPKTLSHTWERNTIWSLFSHYEICRKIIYRETSWKPSRSLMNHTVQTVMVMDGNFIFKPDSYCTVLSLIKHLQTVFFLYLHHYFLFISFIFYHTHFPSFLHPKQPYTTNSALFMWAFIFNQ